MVEFEPYHIHTAYSNCLTQPDSTMSIEDYAKVYKERGHHVLCMSEHGNRSNVWQQFELANKYSDENFRMISLAAAETYFVPDRTIKENRGYHLILIAKNMEGFYQLNEILSEANLSGFYYHARVDYELLSRLDINNFICTSACVAGPTEEEMLVQLHAIFRENFYLEVQHHPQKIQVDRNKWMSELSRKHRWPLIYGTDSHYIYKEEKELRTELMLSKGINYGDEDEFLMFLPTAEEAFQMLREQNVLNKAQIEEAMENTLILRTFEGLHFTNEKKIPNAYPDKTLEERNLMYKKACCYGYIEKAGYPTKEEAKEIHEEMNAVADTNTADYFLIAKRIVDRAKELGGVLTTTGRGSGSSFCTNFSLGFTSVNRLHSPVRLYPDRFISRERMASGILPDLDLNLTNVEKFEQASKEILGEWGCLPMVQYGTTKTSGAFKLLAKAKNIDFTTANEISKEIKNYEMDVKHALDNNKDDVDYDVDEDVQIESYVDEKYLGIVEESKKYLGIILSFAPHPCGHLLLDRDIRREIGVVKTKDAYVAYIDGATADAYGYLKLDFLTVTVVEIISKCFQAIGKPIMPVNELIEITKDDEKVWDLYAKGYTQALNQCEQPKTTERIKQYKPRNIVELSSLVAAIRPGFKSMLSTFLSREPFSYNIPSLDKLLQTKEIPYSFLEYDEQVLTVLIAAGIPAADAYVCLKAIKKKKADKVAPFKIRFKEGFSRHLIEEEGRSEKEAEKVCDQILHILEDSASYLFNASHALCVACDSLYVAYLKAHYPYEFYLTLLKIWDEKKNKQKIPAIIAEMKAYQNISMSMGTFGQDNREWTIDRESKTISQSLSSVKHIPKASAKALYELGKQEEAYMGTEYINPKLNELGKKRRKELNALIKKTDDEEQKAKLREEIDFLISIPEFLECKPEERKIMERLDCFTNVLRALQMNTNVDTEQIRILIELNYFRKYGRTGKLMKVYDKFFNGEARLTKQVKSFNDRLATCREYEKSLPDEDLPVKIRLSSELNNTGLCLSIDDKANTNLYFVKTLDDRYGIKAELYSVKRGTNGIVRIRKDDYAKKPLEAGDCITIRKYDKSPRYVYRNGEKAKLPGEFDIWVKEYTVS